jgi:hypothetical protein
MDTPAPRINRGKPHPDKPHRFPYFHLNVTTGDIRAIRGTHCDNSHILNIPDVTRLIELRRTDKRAYNAELDRIYEPHRESGAFANLFPDTVRTCMFCRSRKGRAIEALARCVCFTEAAFEANSDFHDEFNNEMCAVRNMCVDCRMCRIENRQQDPTVIYDTAVRIGYVPRFNTVAKNVDQILYMSNTVRYMNCPCKDCDEELSYNVLEMYSTVICDMVMRRIERRKHVARVLYIKLRENRIL